MYGFYHHDYQDMDTTQFWNTSFQSELNHNWYNSIYRVGPITYFSLLMLNIVCISRGSPVWQGVYRHDIVAHTRRQTYHYQRWLIPKLDRSMTHASCVVINSVHSKLTTCYLDNVHTTIMPCFVVWVLELSITSQPALVSGVYLGYAQNNYWNK